MNIRNRLTFLFITIVAIIITLSSIAIYFFSANYRQEDFYHRLKNKANNTAKLLIEVEEVDADLLRRIEKNNPVSLPNEKIIIHDFRNNIIFSTDEDHTIQFDDNLLDHIRLEEEVRFRQQGHEVLGFLFKDRYDRFVIIAAATDIYGFNKLRNLRTILIIVFAASIIAVSISGWFYSGKALQPISRVVKQVDEITISSLNLRVDEGNGKDELAQLARTFNNMLERLETSFVVQKNFIANASHELRTPLTSITGQLEVTLLNTRSNDDYRSVLNSVLEDIKSLNNLSNQLLLLAQTSADEPLKNISEVRVDEILWQAKEELIRRNPSYTVNIDLDKSLDDEIKLTLKGDEQLLKVALLNLIENGCKYTSNQSIEVKLIPAPAGLIIFFIDKGIGISEEDLVNIFEPFHRGKNTQHVKGYGIGLSLVTRIIKLHQGTIEVNSVAGSGTTFTVTLPIA